LPASTAVVMFRRAEVRYNEDQRADPASPALTLET